MSSCSSNRDRRALHEAWWQRKNQRPLVDVDAPLELPCPGLDLEVAPEAIVERKCRNLEVEDVLPRDGLRVATVNFGPALLPALAGAGFRSDGYTSWALPVCDELRQLRIAEFDPRHELWQRYEERLSALLASWTWDSYLPGLADYLGPLDILDACLGSQALAMAALEAPEELRRHAEDAARLVCDVLAYETRLHRRAGLEDGVTDCFKVWLPGDGVRLSEDSMALFGPEHVREVFHQADVTVFKFVDSAYLHTHFIAHRALPAVLEMTGLGAVEFGNDPNGPDLDTRIACGRMVQARGLPLQMGNWQRPLSDHEILRLLSELDLRGLRLTFDTPSIEEAHRIYRLVQEEAAARAERMVRRPAGTG